MFLFMFFYASLFKSRCSLKQSLFCGFTLFLQKKVAVFLVFMTFSFFLIWLSIKKDGFRVLTWVKFQESVFLVLIELFKEMPIVKQLLFLV